MIRLCIIFGFLLHISCRPTQARNPQVVHQINEDVNFPSFIYYHHKIWNTYKQDLDEALIFADSAYYWSLHEGKEDQQLTALLNLVLVHGALQNHLQAEAYLSEASCISPSLDSTGIYAVDLRNRIPSPFLDSSQTVWYESASMPLTILALLGIYLASLLFVRDRTKKSLAKGIPSPLPPGDKVWDIRKVAHDLKTPLAKVEGLSKMMIDAGKLNSNQRYYLDMIQKVVREGQDMIQLMLHAQNGITAFMPMKSEVFSLEDLLLAQLPSFYAVAQLKEIQIVQQLTAEHPMIHGHPVAVSRILDNLMSNALKFSPPSGTVWVSLEDEGHSLTLRVKDEGAGMSAADVNQIFSHPEKLASQPTAGESSNGLGLSIVKRLAEEMGGYIQIESELGYGTTILLTFPRIPHPTVKS